jgi:hypothetical protein
MTAIITHALEASIGYDARAKPKSLEQMLGAKPIVHVCGFDMRGASDDAGGSSTHDSDGVLGVDDSQVARRARPNVKRRYRMGWSLTGTNAEHNEEHNEEHFCVSVAIFGMHRTVVSATAASAGASAPADPPVATCTHAHVHAYIQ